ncbi:MAG TPA: response regulator [Beijerinckiaceae bacterium]|jgi:CheY-like chemotaxis protein
MPDGEGNGSGWLALVADESLEFRAGLAAAIQGFDPTIRVIGASTGTEARNLLLRRRPQLAFVNLHLPKLTGAEALAWSVTRGVRPFSVVMTDAVLPRWVELSIELQAYEFLRKPFDPAHVVHMLEARRRMAAPLKVLLADGSASARQLVRRVLAESRFAMAVDEIDDGRHALKLLRAGGYDVALVDRHLPALDGLELACQAARAAPGTKLMLMASGDAAGVAQAVRQFGIVALLRKPFYLWDAEIALHTAFSLRRPYLLNALPAHHEAEARRVRERLAETAAAYAARAEPAPLAPPPPPPQPGKEAEGIFYL